ncbi:MAG: pyridoxal phosphate-dependent aminotransferase [Hyphomicrobiaceae bacterium]
MTQPPLTALINAIPATVPFVGPEAQERERGHPFKARIGANENGFGPSPKALAAMQEAVAGNWQYADPTSFDLISAIAKLHAIPAANVVVGEGIDGLLGLTFHMAVERGAAVVTSKGAYPTFNFHVVSHGGNLVTVPYVNDREDISGLLEAARANSAAILYLSNPDNPMGSWWSAAEIERLTASLPPGCLLCLDEAYIDTLPKTEHPSIDVENPQVLRFRTLSKAYGLAGARIGYAFGPERLIAAFEKVRNHYGINRVGQIGALAAIQDQAYLTQVVANIARARDRIEAIARANGLLPLPSAASFVAIDCGRDGAYAKRILDGLIARDIFVRKPGVAPLDRCIRVSCGTDSALDLFAAALSAAIADARR